MDLKSCLEMEYRLMVKCLRYHDFREGIRAVLIDKDQKPKWYPQTIQDISNEYIEEYFKSLDEFELNLDLIERIAN